MHLVIQLPIFAGIEDFCVRKIEDYAKVIVKFFYFDYKVIVQTGPTYEIFSNKEKQPDLTGYVR